MNDPTTVPCPPLVLADRSAANPAGALVQRSALLRATTDAEAVAAWLAGYRSAATFRAYRKEAERLLFFCSQRGITLHELSYEDLLGFSAHLLNPPPDWIAKAKVPRTDPAWRPMLGPLAPGPHRMAIIVIRKMLRWLKDAGYLDRNPGELIKPGRGPSEAEITRYLPLEAIGFIDAAIATLPDKNGAQARQKARAGFLFSLFYETGIRLSEGVHATMGDMVRDHEGFWALYVLGKGEVEKRPVPVSNRLLADFKAYREAFDCTALPAPGDPSPLIFKLKGKGSITQEACGDAIKLTFLEAADLAQAADRLEIAYALRQASTHWLRHSCMSHLLDDGADIKIVQAIARHQSIATTGRYLHKQKDDLYAAVNKRAGKR